MEAKGRKFGRGGMEEAWSGTTFEAFIHDDQPQRRHSTGTRERGECAPEEGRVTGNVTISVPTIFYHSQMLIDTKLEERSKLIRLIDWFNNTQNLEEPSKLIRLIDWFKSTQNLEELRKLIRLIDWLVQKHTNSRSHWKIVKCGSMHLQSTYQSMKVMNFATLQYNLLILLFTIFFQKKNHLNFLLKRRGFEHISKSFFSMYLPFYSIFFLFENFANVVCLFTLFWL